ncbi:MAG: hypothetical protein ABIJ26_05985 [Candidatus Margulisiibacteriota bacterium]|nr:hypothetical protein [Candidatus Margulisiibacteriota bacterium]
MKRFLILFLTVLFFVPAALAQMTSEEVSSTMRINAQDMRYEGDSIIAEGSAEVDYKDLHVEGEYIRYNTKTDRIFLNRGFVLDYDSLKFSGKVLDYDMVNRSGSAESVKIDYLDNVDFTGQKAVFDSEEMHLFDSSFNACGLDEPHYRVNAREIIFFPQQGWLLSLWGNFQLYSLPGIPIPIYMYDILAEKKGRKNAIPFPVVGSNDSDGTYVLETLGWYHSRELYGTYTAGYSENKGLGAGLTANYIANPNSQGELEIFGYAKDAVWTTLTHRLSFGGEVAPKEEMVFYPEGIFAQLSRQYQLETRLAIREPINYINVSMLPRLTLHINQTTVAGIDLYSEIFTGIVTEEALDGSFWTSGSHIFASLPILKTDLGVLRFDVTSDYRYYHPMFSNPKRPMYWFTLKGHLNTRNQWNEYLNTRLGYIHYFFNQGETPFNYEKYRFDPDDQLDFGFQITRGTIRGGIDALYNFRTMAPNDIDYTLAVQIHCHEISLTYRGIRREFLFGFNLN